jgi:alpha-galactosidase
MRQWPCESNGYFYITHPFAEILYWGPHLRHFSPQDAATLSRPVANGKLDVDSPVTLMAELGHGLFGSPGIEGHRQGLDGSPVFKTTAVEQQGQSLTVTAEDENAGLRLSSEIALDESGVLRVRHGVTNLRPQAWQVDRLAITLPVAERSQEVMAFHGRWIREFQPHRVRLEHDSFVIENRRGKTSHEHFPALITGTPSFNEMQGDVWGVHLGWSGNHRLRAEAKTDGRRYLQAEALYLPGEMAIRTHVLFQLDKRRTLAGVQRFTPELHRDWRGITVEIGEQRDLDALHHLGGFGAFLT